MIFIQFKHPHTIGIRVTRFYVIYFWHLMENVCKRVLKFATRTKEI
jgi:hypothetical protein